MRVILMAAVCVTMAGCLMPTAPKAYEFKKTVQSPASFDQTWAALIEVFAENSWPIQTMEKASGIVATDWMQSPPEYADCGGSGMGVPEAREVRFNVFIRTDAEGVVATTVNTSFRERRNFDGSRVYADCNSKGTAERRIHGMMREVLKRNRTAPPATTDEDAEAAERERIREEVRREMEAERDAEPADDPAASEPVDDDPAP